LLEPESFDTCKNAIAPIMAILDCSEVDIDVSDTDMETVESNDCRGVLENDKDANSVLAVM